MIKFLKRMIKSNGVMGFHYTPEMLTDHSDEMKDYILKQIGKDPLFGSYYINKVKDESK